MKLPLLLSVLVLAGCSAKNPQPAPVAAPPALHAKNVHLVSRTAKYVANLSPAKAVKDTAKVSTFPVRHPKKSAKGLVKVGKQAI